MFDATSPMYDCYTDLIKRQYKNRKSFDEIKNSGSISTLQTWLDQGLVDVVINPSQWIELVNCIELQTKQKQAEIIDTDDVTIGEEISSNIRLSEIEGSSWQSYKAHLINQGWYPPSVEQLGVNAVNTLKRMSRETKERPDGTIKGLVVGHVQSGKTANIASLMSVGADNGWNFFIILSGTIESLRRQTSNRLFKDLNHNGNLKWQQLSQLGSNPEPNHKLDNLLLDNQRNANRYFTVSLKVKSRLHSLVQWLTSNKAKLSQMKLVIIDDEADQASSL